MMTSSNGNIFRVLAICAGNSPVPGKFPAKGQWRGTLMFSLIYAWINDWHDWVNNREAGDFRRQHGHYDVIVMLKTLPSIKTTGKTEIYHKIKQANKI